MSTTSTNLKWKSLATRKANATRSAKQGVGSHSKKSSLPEPSEHNGVNTSKPILKTLSLRALQRIPDTAPERNISRVELILAQKAEEPVFVYNNESPRTREINAAIKSSADWVDVCRAVCQSAGMNVSNAAFALYRLGCLVSFASQKRNEELAASDLVGRLFNFAERHVGGLDAGSVTLLLDGSARLQRLQAPPERLLERLSSLVCSYSTELEASQLPLVLWAFSQLKFIPRRSVLVALDKAVPAVVDAASAQGIALMVTGFQAANYCPSQHTVSRLSEALVHMLPSFKPSELAACLEALSSFGYQPSAQLTKALTDRLGRPSQSNIVSGKGFLRQASSASDHLRSVPHGILLHRHGITLAGAVLGHVQAGMDKLQQSDMQHIHP